MDKGKSKEKILKEIEEYYGLKILEIDDEYITLKIPADLAYKVHHPTLAEKVVFHRKGDEVPPEALYKLYSIKDCERLAQLLNLL